VSLAAGAGRPTRVRYAVLGFIIAAYMITYIDRVLLSAAVPSIQKEFHFSLTTMGWVISAYSIAYALFQIPGGWLGDRLGPRIALAGVVTWWSVFTFCTALTWSAASMAVCLFLFGMGEAGAFPISTRALSRWMLPSERGLAQGSTHAGSRLGGALTPFLVVTLIAAFGWRAPFFSFAVLGVLWAGLWYKFYRNTPAEHGAVNALERDRIRSALGHMPHGRRQVPWGQILSNPQIWILSALYFCYGYNINVFLAWFPKYLNAERHFSLAKMGLFASVPLLAGFLGDICGGVFSDLLLHRTKNLKLSRRLVAMVGFVLAAVTIPLACGAHNPVISVAFFAVAVYGLELTVGVSWAVALDIGGEFAGSVSAVMNTLGNLGAFAAAAVTAYIVKAAGWSGAFYVIAGLSIVAAVLYLGVDASRRAYRVTSADPPESPGAAEEGLLEYEGL
jgi:MFS transporter, ACS family, glucarate transporter